MYIDINTLLGLLIIAAIVLAIYLIIAVYNFIKTLKQSQKVLSDFEIVAKISSERTQQLDKFIEQTQKKVKSSQNIVNAIPIIVSAVSNIAKVIGQQGDKKARKESKK